MADFITPIQIILIVFCAITIIVTKVILGTIIWGTAHLKGYDRMAGPFVAIGCASSCALMLLVMFFLPIRESDVQYKRTPDFTYCPVCGSRVYPGAVKCPTCRREIERI